MKIFKSIINNLEDISNILNNIAFVLKEDKSIYIHILGAKSKKDFEILNSINLEFQTNIIQVLWCGWSSQNIFSYLLYPFVSGFGGLLKINRYQFLGTIYKHIGGLSFCQIYFIDSECETKIIKMVNSKVKPLDKIDSIVNDNSKDYIIVSIDTEYMPHILELKYSNRYNHLIDSIKTKLDNDLKKCA